MRAITAILLLGAIVTASATAQIGMGRLKTTNLAGDFVLPAGASDVTATVLGNIGDDGTGLNDFHGITLLPNGHYLVSQGARTFQFKKLFFELDSDGSMLASIEQPDDITQFGRNGLTNLIWDRDTGPNSRVWGVRAKAIRSYDWRARTFDDINVPTNLTVGLKSLDQYGGGEARAAAIAEIDGTRILVSSSAQNVTIPIPASAATNYHEIGTSLAVIPPHKPPTPNIAPALDGFDEGKLGAAFDPIHETIWWHIDEGNTGTNPNQSATRFFEMDMDGNLTGKIIQGDRGIGGIARGCDMHVDSEGNLVLTYLVSMGLGSDNPLSLPLDQDVMVEMYANYAYGTSCGGEVGFIGEAYIGNLDWLVTLHNAPSNPTNLAFVMRGTGTAIPGLIIPDILGCPLQISFSGAVTRAVLLVNGEASFNQQLPASMSLVGIEPAFQWLMTDSNGDLPLNLSDTGMIRIGTNL